MRRHILFIIGIFLLYACKQSGESNTEAVAQNTIKAIEVQMQDGLKRAYFASGCFWCVEAIYESVDGVEEAVSGYSGGKTKNPSYRNHADHAETIEVYYNPNIVSFETLVDVYFGSQNITQVNGQGPDRGTSYRSIIFYQNETEKNVVKNKIDQLNQKLGGDKVAAQVMPFQKFWKAEDYHQDYKKNNPGNPYIQNVSIPRLNNFKKKFPHLLNKSIESK